MKERLTGAIILVVLIVLLVPELLSGPKGPAASAPAGAASPSSEEPPLRSYTINLGDDSHSQSQAAASTAASNGPAMPQPSGPEQPTAQPDTQQSGSPATPSQSAPVQATGTPPTVISEPANPQQSAAGGQTASPGEAAAPAHGETPTPQQPSSRDHAASPDHPLKAAAAQKLAKAHSTDAAATGTRSESGAWAVQLGVFASRGNAERLALEVRVKGFKASVSPVSRGGRKLYRVRVGPTADRSGAQELQGRLKAAGRPGGTVVPYS